MKLQPAFLRLLALTAAALASQASAATLYSNGSINGNYDAFTINSRYSVTNSFTLAGTASLATADVGLWVDGGATPTAVSWEIGTTQFGSDISAGTATLTNTFHNSVDGYSVYDSTFALSGVLPSAGTYYFTLLNATSSDGKGIYWDENNGPSTAAQAYYGSSSTPQGSESFTLSGASTPTSTVPDTGTTWAMLLGSVGLLLGAHRLYGTRRA